MFCPALKLKGAARTIFWRVSFRDYFASVRSHKTVDSLIFFFFGIEGQGWDEELLLGRGGRVLGGGEVVEGCTTFAEQLESLAITCVCVYMCL